MDWKKELKDILELPRKLRETAQGSRDLVEEASKSEWICFEKRLSLHVGNENAAVIVRRMRTARSKVPPYELSHIGDWVKDFIVDWREKEQNEGWEVRQEVG